MRKRRRSSAPERTEFREYRANARSLLADYEPRLLAALQRDTEERDRRWLALNRPLKTMLEVRMSQPNPYETLIPARHRLQQAAVKRPRDRYPHHVVVGDALVDVHTGEILSAKKLSAAEVDHPLHDRLEKCKREREQRRASLIASGHGGKNGVINYEKHKDC